MAQQDEDFKTAFNEDQPEPQVPSEDEAFGIQPPEPEEVPAGDGTSTEGDAPAVTSTEAPAADAAPTDGAPAADSPAADAQSEADAQRERSWEGRLKAREAELAQRAADLDAREAAMQAGDGKPSGDAGQPEIEINVGGESGEGGEGGEGDGEPEDVKTAIAQMTEDFGPEFVNAIKVIAGHYGGRSASDSVGAVNKSIEDVIAGIKDRNVQDHFERILDRHGDFFDVYQSPEFGAWRDGLPDEAKADAQRIEATGTAREVNGLLDRFKKASEAGAAQADTRAPADAKPDNATENAGVQETDPWDEAADAEGVRSSGLRLPPDVSPSNNDDFIRAFNEA